MLLKIYPFDLIINLDLYDVQEKLKLKLIGKIKRSIDIVIRNKWNIINLLKITIS